MTELELLTPQQTGKFLGISINTLSSWRLNKKGPTYIKLEGKVYYRKSDIEKYLEERTITAKGETA